MLVSHDRALLRSVCDEFWLVARGGVDRFDGDLDDYQRYLLDEAKRLREQARVDAQTPAASAAPEPSKSIAKTQDLTRTSGPLDAQPAADARGQRKQGAQTRQLIADKVKPLRRELEACDQKILALNTEKFGLEKQLSAPLAAAEMAAAGKRLKAVNDELQTLEDRWLALSEEIEGVSAG